MGSRKYLLILALVVASCSVKAQIMPLLPPRVDSAAYANFVAGNYSLALSQYNDLLANDSYNTTAQYYAYLCSKYLNHELLASYHAARLDTGQQNYEHINNFALIDAGFETSVKVPNDLYRGTASYTRVSLTNRLSWRLQLEQSVAFFGQQIDKRPNTTYKVAFNPDQQLEYYTKLSYSATANLALFGAYHYLYTNYQSTNYNSNVGVTGIKYTGTYFDIWGDFDWSFMIDHHLIQYNAGLMFYPLGNLNFYTISRVSNLNQNAASQVIFSQAVGFKAFKNVWLETSGTFGNLDNYIDADGLYIYNTIDASKLKLGQTIFYQAGKHAQLQLNYTFEKKQDDLHSLTYDQHSVTAGILWKF